MKFKFIDYINMSLDKDVEDNDALKFECELPDNFAVMLGLSTPENPSVLSDFHRGSFDSIYDATHAYLFAIASYNQQSPETIPQTLFNVAVNEFHTHHAKDKKSIFYQSAPFYYKKFLNAVRTSTINISLPPPLHDEQILGCLRSVVFEICLFPNKYGLKQIEYYCTLLAKRTDTNTIQFQHLFTLVGQLLTDDYKEREINNIKHAEEIANKLINDSEKIRSQGSNYPDFMKILDECALTLMIYEAYLANLKIIERKHYQDLHDFFHKIVKCIPNPNSYERVTDRSAELLAFVNSLRTTPIAKRKELNFKLSFHLDHEYNKIIDSLPINSLSTAKWREYRFYLLLLNKDYHSEHLISDNMTLRKIIELYLSSPTSNIGAVVPYKEGQIDAQNTFMPTLIIPWETILECISELPENPAQLKADDSVVRTHMFSNFNLESFVINICKNATFNPVLLAVVGLINDIDSRTGAGYYYFPEMDGHRNYQKLVLMFLKLYYIQAVIHGDEELHAKLELFYHSGMYKDYLNRMKYANRQEDVIYQILHAISSAFVFDHRGNNEIARMNEIVLYDTIRNHSSAADLELITRLITVTSEFPNPVDLEKILDWLNDKEKIENHPLQPLIEQFLEEFFSSPAVERVIRYRLNFIVRLAETPYENEARFANSLKTNKESLFELFKKYYFALNELYNDDELFTSYLPDKNYEDILSKLKENIEQYKNDTGKDPLLSEEDASKVDNEQQMTEDQAREYLGITHDVKLTQKLINRQYRVMALLYHPDRNKSEDGERNFIRISKAKDLLLSITPLEDSIASNPNRFYKRHDNMNNDVPEPKTPRTEP